MADRPDSRAYTGALKDTFPETLETLRQADEFARLAQDQTLSGEMRQTYLNMATLRYNKVMIKKYE